ncbi:MAG: sigma-70 family RNA polymerase sigma factor [Planctomycetota bacterium]
MATISETTRADRPAAPPGALERAIEDAERAGVPRGAVSVQRLGERSVRTFRDAWDEDAHERVYGRLVDLVWSLACEQRPDWQEEAFSPETANSTFDALVTRDLEAVHAFVLGRMPALGTEAALDAAMDAFARAFQAYWSVEAKKAFRGQSRLRTLLCTIAHREGVRALDRKDETVSLDPALHDGPAAADGSQDGSFGDALQRALADCLDELPPKRQLVATRRWEYEERPADIADALGISRPAVSNHLNKARPALETCLNGKGIRWDGEA